MARQSSESRDPKRVATQAADSYYTVIRGKKYDRRMLELAEGLTSGRGDGRISINDAKNLLRVVKDANNYSNTEKQTMEYIRKHFKFTKEGDDFFRSEIRKWAAGKGKKKATAKAKKPAAVEAVASSPAHEAEAVAAAAAAPVETKSDTARPTRGGSAFMQILVGLVLIAGLAALFYFIVYKSSCARPQPGSTPPAATGPVTTPPAATVPAETPKAAEVPAAPAKPVAEQKQSPSPAPVNAELQMYVSKTSLRFIAEKTALSPASEKALDELAARLKSSGGRLQVTGHTCSLGPKSINQAISEKRALVVKEALVARGIAADRIETLGAADTQPVGNNKTVEGRVANRRVSFKLLN